MTDKIDRSSLVAIKHTVNQEASLRVAEAREMFLRHMLSTLDAPTDLDAMISDDLMDLYCDIYLRNLGKDPEQAGYGSTLANMTKYFFEGLREVWPDADPNAVQLFRWPVSFPRDRDDYPCTLVNELAWLLGHMEGERFTHNQFQA